MTTSHKPILASFSVPLHFLNFYYLNAKNKRKHCHRTISAIKLLPFRLTAELGEGGLLLEKKKKKNSLKSDWSQPKSAGIGRQSSITVSMQIGKIPIEILATVLPALSYYHLQKKIIKDYNKCFKGEMVCSHCTRYTQVRTSSAFLINFYIS